MTTNMKQVLVVVPMWILAGGVASMPDSWIHRIIVLGILALSGIFMWQTGKKDRKKTKSSYPWMH
jgi:hypothetical protein